MPVDLLALLKELLYIKLVPIKQGFFMRYHFLLCLLFGFLISCDNTKQIVTKEQDIPIPSQCPKINIISGAHHMVGYNDKGKDITDQIFNATLSYGDGECSGNFERINTILPIIIKTERGPAMDAEDMITINIVIAIANKNNNTVLQRRIIPIGIEYTEIDLDKNYREAFFVNINDFDYNQEIFIGFAIDEEVFYRNLR